MARLRTVEVAAPDGGTMIINESDYDAKRHTLAGKSAAKAKRSKRGRAKASDSSPAQVSDKDSDEAPEVEATGDGKADSKAADSESDSTEASGAEDSEKLTARIAELKENNTVAQLRKLAKPHKIKTAGMKEDDLARAIALAEQTAEQGDEGDGN